jgi:hypothetical protein
MKYTLIYYKGIRWERVEMKELSEEEFLAYAAILLAELGTLGKRAPHGEWVRGVTFTFRYANSHETKEHSIWSEQTYQYTGSRRKLANRLAAAKRVYGGILSELMGKYTGMAYYHLH